MVKERGSGSAAIFIVGGLSFCLAMEARKTEKYKWIRYYFRRWTRILPLYAFMVGGSVWLNMTPKRSLVYGLMMANWVPKWGKPDPLLVGDWFLTPLMSFYLVFPVICSRYGGWLRSMGLVLGSMSAIVVSFEMMKREMIPGVDVVTWSGYLFWTLYQMPSFLAGTWIYYWFVKKEKIKWWGWLVVVGFGWVCWKMAKQNLYVDVYNLLWANVVLVGLVVLAIKTNWRVFRLKLLRWWGKYSWEIFLLHLFVNRVVRNWFVGKESSVEYLGLRILLVMIISGWLGVMLRKFVEKPWMLGANSMFEEWLKKSRWVDKLENGFVRIIG